MRSGDPAQLYTVHVRRFLTIVVFFLTEQDLVEPQTKLLQYVIAQPYSRDVICTMLGLNKQVWFLNHYVQSMKSKEKMRKKKKRFYQLRS